jgi:hypothetical protein
MQVYQLPALLVLGGLVASLSGCASPTYTLRPTTTHSAEAPGRRAVVVVRVPTPWYAPRFVVRGKFHDALPEYEALAPLDAKYFSISDDRRFGGLYLWKTRDDAERHFDAAWHASVRRRRGVDADVLVMDAPYVVEGRALPGGKPEGARSVDYPAWASLVRWELPPGADPMASATTLAAAPWSSDALIRGMIVTGPQEVGVVALWATREAAERAVTAEARGAIGRSIVASASTFVLFETPLLIDETIRSALDAR